jgi:hypothetical protein
MSRPGSGRQRGVSYRRRTDAEISRGVASQQRQVAQQRQQNVQRRANFFKPCPHQQQNQRADPPPDQAQGDLARAQNNRSPGPPLAAQAPAAKEPPPEDQHGGSCRHRHLEPTYNAPLSGVNMDNIPPIFWRQVGQVMHDVWKKMISGIKNSNQHQRFSTGAHNFPWATEKYDWPRPFKLNQRPTFVESKTNIC